MLKTISIVSTHPGSGQTTITINLASGLVRNGFRVLIGSLNCNDKLGRWLGIDSGQYNSMNFKKSITNGILTSQIGIDWLIMNSSIEDSSGTTIFLPDLKGLDYDFLLLLPASKSDCCRLDELSDYLIVCTDLSHSNEVDAIISLENDLYNPAKPGNSISMLVLNKINTKEWEHNSQQLFALADYFGYERIADPIPHCERIHDLPLDGRTVWELSQQNIKDAFMSLVETVQKLQPGIQKPS